MELEAGRKFDDYPIPDGATIKILKMARHIKLPERRFHYILVWAVSGKHIGVMTAPNPSVDCGRFIKDMEEGLFEEEWGVPRAATTETGEKLEHYRACWGDVELEAGRKFPYYSIPEGATIKIIRCTALASSQSKQ